MLLGTPNDARDQHEKGYLDLQLAVVIHSWEISYSYSFTF